MLPLKVYKIRSIVSLGHCRMENFNFCAVRPVSRGNYLAGKNLQKIIKYMIKLKMKNLNNIFEHYSTVFNAKFKQVYAH